MSPSGKKKATSLELQPVQGRLDVLAYRLAESGVRMAEAKLQMTGIWDVVKKDIEGLIDENIGRGIVPQNDVCFNLLRKLMEVQRTNARM